MVWIAVTMPDGWVRCFAHRHDHLIPRLLPGAEKVRCAGC